MSSFAIHASQLSKLYRIEGAGSRKKKRNKLLSDRIQESLTGIWRMRGGGATRPDPDRNHIWALKDVSFEIPHGASFGIIGENGAGKTTLLKILSRITAPTEGRIRMRGRVGSLLEVGTGFHSELTGRENVYLNGSILGMRKQEIDRKFDEIVDFSGVEAFIDTPVKRYSSGMRMRLAFSVAAHLEPEILLVDEVLAVGDINFQNKSLDKMRKVTREGRTILFVSHNLGAVRALCPQSMFLKHGGLEYLGPTETATQMYLQDHDSLEEEQAALESTRRAQILSVYACDANGVRQQTFPHDKPVFVRIKVYLNLSKFNTHLMLRVYGEDLETVLVTYDFEPDGASRVPAAPGTHDFEVRLPARFLNPAKYYLGVQVSRQTRKNQARMVDRLDHRSEFMVFDNGSLLSQLNLPWQGLVHNDSIQWTRLDGSADAQSMSDGAHAR